MCIRDRIYTDEFHSKMEGTLPRRETYHMELKLLENQERSGRIFEAGTDRMANPRSEEKDCYY